MNGRLLQLLYVVESRLNCAAYGTSVTGTVALCARLRACCRTGARGPASGLAADEDLGGLADRGELGQDGGGVAVQCLDLDIDAEVAGLGDQGLEHVGVGRLDLMFLLAERDLGRLGGEVTAGGVGEDMDDEEPGADLLGLRPAK